MNIFLIGLPGSGKSTLGRELARQLDLTFVDTDAEIVAAEGKAIDQIFKDSGEDYFRKLEQTIVHRISEKNQQLISTGGGTPCFYDNMKYMKGKGTVIFIDVPIEELYHRLRNQKSYERPMLKGKTEKELLLFLKQKHFERIPYYSKADIRIEGPNIQTSDIIQCLKAKN